VITITETADQLPPKQAITITEIRKKGDGWRAAREMSRDDIDGTDLGRFLAELAEHVRSGDEAG
jgi:hypothetical protein